MAFEFPPLASGGVYRALKLAEHLPRHGVELDVVTVRAHELAVWSTAPMDESLASDLDHAVQVHRIPTGFPGWYWRLTRRAGGHFLFRHLYWGDPVAIFWRRPLLDLLDRVIEERQPDVLLATAPPFGVSILARSVAHRYRIPWIVDWRDSWMLWQMAPFASYGHYRYIRAREGSCLREANRSISTSHVTRDDWLAEFRDVDPTRLRVIYNGYDEDELSNVAPELAPAGRVRIAYVGSFYYDPAQREAMYSPVWRRPPKRWLHWRRRREDWLYRSPYFFLRGLQHLVQRDPVLADRLEVVFAGSIPSWLPWMLVETGTRDRVILRGHVSHREALALQAGADALLLTSAKVEGGRDYSIAGKTYEYIGLGKPILAIVCPGAMRDIVTWSGSGYTVDPDDTEQVADALASLARGARPPAPDDVQSRFITSLRRSETARQMSEELRAAASEGYRGKQRARTIVENTRFVPWQPFTNSWAPRDG